jgi:hypothetical protein
VSAEVAELAARALKRGLAAARARYRKQQPSSPSAARSPDNVAALHPTESGGVRLTG